MMGMIKPNHHVASDIWRTVVPASLLMLSASCAPTRYPPTTTLDAIAGCSDGDAFDLQLRTEADLEEPVPSELLHELRSVIAAGATGGDGFLESGTWMDLEARWERDPVQVERAMARLVSDERITTRTEAAGAATVYAELSGRLGPLLESWNTLHWGRWTEILFATQVVETPTQQAVIDAMACTAAWHLTVYAERGPFWLDDRVNWRPSWELMIMYAWEHVTPDLRTQLEGQWLARVPDAATWLPN